jgi:Cof subfamily protein (haloacid dehalogenase superfamily)
LNYRLAAIDLDGTLLHSQTHQISPGNAAAVARAMAQGALLILASGRQHETTAAFATELRFSEATPLISYNGALVRTLGGETMAHQPLPADAAEQIVRFCAEHGHHLNYYLDDLLYVRDQTRWSEIYQQRTGSVPRVMHDLRCFDGRRPTKLLLIDAKAVTDALLTHFQGVFGDSLYITKTEDEYLEFMDRGVSKGVALARVAASLGIPREQCVAVGDSYNDVPMVQWAGLGAAVSSGKVELKRVADRIAPPADEDGVGVLLDELFPSA